MTLQRVFDLLLNVAGLCTRRDLDIVDHTVNARRFANVVVAASADRAAGYSVADTSDGHHHSRQRQNRRGPEFESSRAFCSLVSVA